ncbi:MAG: DUF4340 domain-containing protein [Deltaproteobacteria bacterium]|nr:DUF4340 domain-containing protein [Deltaproteobacteria bacterium]
MRLRNTLLLASIFILLVAYVYFFELQKGPKEKTEKLLNFKEGEAQSLILNYPDREIRLRRDPQGRWKIFHPLEAAADESTISSILSALSTSEVKRTVEERPSPAGLKNYGLDRPEVKVLVSLANGLALPPVAVGAKTPVGNSVYVRRGTESGVLLTDASLRSNLEKKLNDLRDKTILEFTEGAVKQLAIRGSTGDFALSKKEEYWFIDRPRYYRADQAEVRGLLSTVRNLSTLDFIEESPLELKKFGLDKPRLKITVVTGEADGVREILFGGKREGKDEVYAVVDSKGTVYTLGESVLKQLEKGLTALRDKEILSARPDQMARVEIRTPKDSLVLAKGEKGQWRLDAPKKGIVKQAAVSSYLSLLSRLSAKGFADDEAKDLKKYGLNPPSLKISVADKDGKNLGTLLLGSKTGADYYAAREGSPAVYAIDESSYNQLNKQLSDFLEEGKKANPAASGAKK